MLKASEWCGSDESHGSGMGSVWGCAGHFIGQRRCGEVAVLFA
jgi:hypothetical protein